MHSCACHAYMSELFSMILFENKHNTWLIHFILLKYQFKSYFLQNYTKIKICVFIAVIYIIIYHEFVDRIDNYVARVTVWHHKALPSDVSDPRNKFV